MKVNQQQEIAIYKVWDLPVRVFHWVNFLCVISLLFMGFIMLYKKELGITSLDAKIGLKQVHVIIGYVFAVNLLTRFAWAFIGNRYARWSALLPNRGVLSDARRYVEAMRQGQPQAYLGHNPLGRLAVAFLLLLMTTMAVTGLVRAGTDIYFPPFGSWVQGYIAADQVPPSSLKPYDETQVDAEKFQTMNAFKSPFGKVHLYTAYTLLGMLLLHIAAVIVTEKREGGAIISAMFTGKKYLSGRPRDATDQE
ncbi:MAG: cytochrome b/b6 domain-containing protein [Pseudomonadota bacterium]|nr:cytochrome b/b6 domain-containing protein [Pseudomonadota bacterium]